MNRITHVELDGFKGIFRRHELGPLTLLSGPNGLGKSAVLEGLRYALSGEVPSGKASDEVAKYFPPRGGAVLVIDAAENWIRRGITRDHEKAKVSTEFEEEGDAEWVANDALLDMRGFLALSPNKRREFILELVGAGETPTDKEVHQALARGYAKEIGGAGADVAILDGRKNDLPDEIRPLAGLWLNLWSVLSSYLKTGERTASAIFQRLADASKDRKNAARVAANEAKAAIRELEAAAKGAEAAAADLEARRGEAREAQEALSAVRESAAARREISRQLDGTKTELGELVTRLASVDEIVDALTDPGPRPDVESGEDQETERWRAEAKAASEEALKARDARRVLEACENELAQREAALEVARRDVAALEKEPIGRASLQAEKVREYVASSGGSHVCIRDLLDLVDELAESWRKRRDVAVERVAAWDAEAREFSSRRLELTKATPTEEEYKALVSRTFELDDKEQKAARYRRDRVESQKRALEAWEGVVRQQDQVRAEQKAARERYHAARGRQDELAGRLDELAESDVGAAEEAAGKAREALEAAEEAAGAVKAYREAVDRAEGEKVSENAWKAAEAACKRARETYVGEIVRPIVDDVAALLRAAGRQERVYLLLENERGKPVFDLGWSLRDSRRSLSALSGGEAVLFTTALALTIARRATGRRVLLIEADPLDEQNLLLLLEALSRMEIELDACVVATSRWVEKKVGWRVLQFTEEGVTT